MKYLLYSITFLLFFSSCSEYQKVFKNEEIAPKYALGEKLYNQGDYKKAQNLFVQIVPNYRSGKAGAEKLMYMYGNTFYLLEDWNGAAYNLERFTKAYSRSEKLEEMAFKSAKSNYYLSPKSTLDQEDTEKAILKLQNFMNTYPKSDYLKEASIGRVLVKKDERKYGYGHDLMKESIVTILKEFKTSIIHISAQTYLEKFYNTHGFQQTGEGYLEDGIPHIKMIMN